MARCPKCNTEATSRFCPNCGNDMTAHRPPIAAATEVMPPYKPSLEQPVPPGSTPQVYAPYPGQAFGAPPQRPASVWQGIVTLVVSFVISALMGLALLAADPWEVKEMIVGVYFILIVAGLVILPFGLWSLVSNRTSGKVMASFGLGMWLLVMVAAFLK